MEKLLDRESALIVHSWFCGSTETGLPCTVIAPGDFQYPHRCGIDRPDFRAWLRDAIHRAPINDPRVICCGRDAADCDCDGCPNGQGCGAAHAAWQDCP